MSPSGVESREAFQGRILRAQVRWDDDFAGLRILVVTHRVAIRVLAPDVRRGHAELVQV